jgi:hypothetical protein
MISLDGTVNDYLDRGITPNLEAIGKYSLLFLLNSPTGRWADSCLSLASQGVRAQYMNPSFPVRVLQTTSRAKYVIAHTLCYSL